MDYSSQSERNSIRAPAGVRRRPLQRRAVPFQDGRPRNDPAISPPCPVDHDGCPAGRTGVSMAEPSVKMKNCLLMGLLSVGRVQAHPNSCAIGECYEAEPFDQAGG